MAFCGAGAASKGWVALWADEHATEQLHLGNVLMSYKRHYDAT